MAKSKKALKTEENKTLQDDEMVDTESGKAKNIKDKKPIKTNDSSPKTPAKTSPKASPKVKESPKKKKEESSEEDDDEEDDDDDDDDVGSEEEEETSTPKSNGNTPDSKKRKSDSQNSPNKLAKTDVLELYVGNIPYDGQEAEYKSVFEEYGTLDNIDWKVDSNGKFRGFCYITYKTNEAAQKALSQLDSKTVNGRQIRCEVTKKDDNKSNPPSTTIFVGNLPENVTNEELRAAFSKHGTIKDIRLVNDRRTGEFKRCSFIDFDDQATADKVFQTPHTIRGNELKVDFASPKTEGRPAGRSSGGGGGRGGGRGGGGRGGGWGGGRGGGGRRGGRGSNW